VEFNERGSVSIRQLSYDIRKAFVSTENIQYKERGVEGPAVRLIYHGRILLEDGTIDDNNIRPGDTIVAIIDTEIPKIDVEIPKPVEVPVRVEPSLAPEVVALIAKQQDTMKNVAQEMRLGWEAALQSLATKPMQQEPKAAPNPDLLSQMDDKYRKLEQAMRDQLDSQLGQYKELLNAENGNRKGKLRVGDLESDTDEVMVTRDELAGKLRDSYEKIRSNKGEIDSMRDMQSRQDREMEELRRQIAAKGEKIKNVYNTYNNETPQEKLQSPVVAPIIEEKKVIIKEPEISIPLPLKLIETPIKSSMKNSPRKPTIVENPIKKIEKIEKIVEDEILETEKILEKIEEKTEIIEEIVVSDFIDINFSLEFNPDLRILPGKSKEHSDNLENVVINLLKDLSVEDLIFELRHGVATQLSVPLNRVVLELYGRTVTMGLDVEEDENSLDAEKAAVLAQNGNLLVKIRRGKLLNDSQLDLMVNHYEGQQLLGKVALPITSESPLKSSLKGPLRGSIEEGLSRGIALGGKKKPREWDDDREDVWGTKNEVALRKSLRESLESLSDKEGLTDDELDGKMRTLRNSTEGLSGGLSKHIKDYKGSVAGVVAAAVDSGSEDFYIGSNNSIRKSNSTVSLRLSETAQDSNQQLRSSRSFLENSQNSSSMLRLSIPSGTRRSLQAYEDEDEDDDYSYGTRSGSYRQFAEDSSPMMQSLSMPKDGTLLSADMKLSQSISSQDYKNYSQDDKSDSEYAEGNGRSVKKLSFNDTQEDSGYGSDTRDRSMVEEVESDGVRGLRARNDSTEEESLFGGYDLNRTVDTEGEVIKMEEVPAEKFKQRAEEYEAKYSDDPVKKKYK